VSFETFQSETPFGVKPFSGIIAIHNNNVCKRYVIACHFDSKYFKTEFIGAVDSAVPCALIIHLALILNNKLIEHKKKV
jgi:glutaminyl-peptide cyclotransferase